MSRTVVDLIMDFQDLPFDVSKHSEALDSFAALNLEPRSIKPALRARDLVFVRVPSCKFRIGVTGDPDAQEKIENSDGSIAFEVIYKAKDPVEAHQIRSEVERYFLRHYPGRTLAVATDAGHGNLTGTSVYVTCRAPSNSVSPKAPRVAGTSLPEQQVGIRKRRKPMIRKASEDDIPPMTALAEMKRSEYVQYAPTFWRNAEDAAQKQAPYFRAQLSQEDTICLVAEHEGDVTGFIFAKIVTAPPVYDPGSLVCMIDDFVVASSDQWAHTGKDLLQAVRRRAKSRGASLVVVVCGHLDEPKREMLRAADFYIASEWYVSP